jgi:hypothetical protein
LAPPWWNLAAKEINQISFKEKFKKTKKKKGKEEEQGEFCGERFTCVGLRSGGLSFPGNIS